MANKIKKLTSSHPFSNKDINKLNNFMYNQGMPKNIQLPKDFSELLKKYGYFEVTLLESKTELKYVQIGGESAQELIENLNDSTSYIKHPALAIGINGMGQTLLYIYMNNKLALYIIKDGDFLDDELIFLSNSITSFLTNKDNLQYLE